tara:strand:+ start:217 stop:507 length:291 start_codon:yes stop_codon:yes gene_type:complete
MKRSELRRIIREAISNFKLEEGELLTEHMVSCRRYVACGCECSDGSCTEVNHCSRECKPFCEDGVRPTAPGAGGPDRGTPVRRPNKLRFPKKPRRR